MLRFLTRLPRRAKQGIILAMDVALVPFAFVATYALQANAVPVRADLTDYWPAIPLLMLIAGLLAFVLGIHRVQLKSYETEAVAKTALHAVLTGLATALIDLIAAYGTPVANLRLVADLVREVG